MKNNKYNATNDFHTTTNTHVYNLLKWKHAHAMSFWDFAEKRSHFYNRNRNPCDWKSHRQNQWR